jgi:hypothetical protein
MPRCGFIHNTRTEIAALLVGRSQDRFPLVSLDFSVTYSFRPYRGSGVDSAPSENEYQEHFLGVKEAGAWGWQPHRLHVPNVLEIWEPKPPGTLWATPGLLRDSITFTFTRREIISETRVTYARDFIVKYLIGILIRPFRNRTVFPRRPIEIVRQYFIRRQVLSTQLRNIYLLSFTILTTGVSVSGVQEWVSIKTCTCCSIRRGYIKKCNGNTNAMQRVAQLARNWSNLPV